MKWVRTFKRHDSTSKSPTNTAFFLLVSTFIDDKQRPIVVREECLHYTVFG